MDRRGSWFKYEALYPNGRRETLFSLPAFAGPWRRTYRLATPRRVPAGTLLLATGGYDNSQPEPREPDGGRARDVPRDGVRRALPRRRRRERGRRRADGERAMSTRRRLGLALALALRGPRARRGAPRSAAETRP